MVNDLYIEKVQVEEGFLDGVNIVFRPGLNTIIGARGTGKSSLLEIIRFALGAKSYSDESKRKSLDHATSVLGSGQVTVTIRNGEQQINVTRSIDDEKPEADSPYIKPMVFSQSEVESIGLHANGRMRIIDGYVHGSNRFKPIEDNAKAIIRSLTSDIADLKNTIDELEQQIAKSLEYEERLKILSLKEDQVINISADAQKKSSALTEISEKITKITLEEDQIEVFGSTVGALNSNITAAIEKLSPKTLLVGSSNSFIETATKKVEEINELFSLANDSLQQISIDADKYLEGIRAEKRQLNERSRALRTSIEELQKGAGVIVREGQKLREQIAQLNALKAHVKNHYSVLESLKLKRAEQLDILETCQLQKFEGRVSAERHINDTLGPQIKVRMVQQGNLDNYISALTDALKGSGTQYKSLVPIIAKNISPRELVELVDGLDVEGFSIATRISRDRAAKIIISLNSIDLGDIASIELDDTVEFLLLDGDDYKGFSDLSTGQRCTVILPLILEQTDKVIIIDQPEDHIDNGFITETLIKAILRRSNKGQLILTTHNANIPVLGEASNVIQLASDGSRGYIKVANTLEDPQVVDAISNIMEGGSEAFEKRANFYNFTSLAK